MKKNFNNFLVRPNDSLKMKWDGIVMALALINIFQVPLKIAFEPAFLYISGIQTVDFIIDFVFFLDILVCFRTVYLNDKGDWEQRSS